MAKVNKKSICCGDDMFGGACLNCGADGRELPVRGRFGIETLEEEAKRKQAETAYEEVYGK